MWFIFVLLAGLLGTISGLLSRHLLKSDKDPWALSFWFSFFGALVSLPFAISDAQFSHGIRYWIFLIFSTFVIVVHNLLVFYATRMIQPSLQAALTKLRLIWIFVIGIVLLNESLNIGKTLGMLFAFFAGLVIIKTIDSKLQIKGVFFIIISTFTYSFGITAFSYLLDQFNPATLTFLIFVLPMVFNFILMPKRVKRISTIIKVSPVAVILICITSAFSNLALNYALDNGEQSQIIVITESFIVMTLAGEHMFLKEKEHLLRKIIAVILALVGTLLIRLS